MFKLFAELIATHLDAANRVAVSEATLLGERETSELREQFIAVLGHDLRNPLASIAAGTKLLMRGNRDAAPILALMQQSVARMSALIDNVLDFARGRLGGGVSLNRTIQPLQPVLNQVVAELRAGFPASQIETHFDLAREVDCDGGRIAQLFSNLLGNALTHGTAGSPVRVRATTAGGEFELSVANLGKPIPPQAVNRLFQPFYRVSAQDARQEGLGLGLYIASEIARAHGGKLEVASSAQETRFTFRMPL
jgi:signal transduction histidine kinase